MAYMTKPAGKGTNVERGWQVGKSFVECHKYMLENHVACDVTFLLASPGGDTVEVPAHKFMLVCRSPVFEATLCGEFKEASTNIAITDVELDIFKEILRYIYCDEVNLSGANVMHILFAAQEYILQNLVERCKTYLEHEMSPDNVCSIWNDCQFYEVPELEQKCLKYIVDHLWETTDSDDFMNLKREQLFKVLADDNVGLPEDVVLKAGIKWARHQKKNDHNCSSQSLREILGDSLFQIRFLSMTPDVLIEPEMSELLNKSEQLSLMRCVIQNKAVKDTDIEHFNLSNRTRAPAIITKCRFLNIVCGNQQQTAFSLGQNQSRNSNHTDDMFTLSFCLERPLSFKGVSMFPGLTRGDTHSVILKLYQTSRIDHPRSQKGGVSFGGNPSTSRVECMTGEYQPRNLTSDGTSQPVQVLLDGAVPLVVDCVYTVDIGLVGPPTYWGQRGVGTVEAGDVKVSFQPTVRVQNVSGFSFKYPGSTVFGSPTQAQQAQQAQHAQHTHDTVSDGQIPQLIFTKTK